MIDWLKYYPLALRTTQREGDTFRWPDFGKAKPVTLEFGGNIIRFRAPRHCTEFERNQLYRKGPHELDKSFRPNEGATRNWEHLKMFYRSWTFWLEWFGGGRGRG